MKSTILENKWRILTAIVVGIAIIYRLILNAGTESIFTGFVTLIFSVTFIGILWYCVYHDVKRYRQSRSRSAFISSFVGLVLVLSMIGIQLTLNYRDSSKVIIHASFDGGFNACGFEFREDGTYKFFNGSGLGVDFSRGTYTLNDSLIILDKAQIDNCTKSQLLVIRGDAIYQIDRKHQIADKDFNFIIRTDNR